MAYTHNQFERLVANRVDLATDTSYFMSAGFTPFILKAAAVVVTTATASSSVIVTITRRITAGSNTGEVAVDVITVPVSTAQGSVVYVDGLDTKVSPGEELEFAVSGSGTGNGDIVAFCEMTWEHPSNNTDMSESA